MSMFDQIKRHLSESSSVRLREVLEQTHLHDQWSTDALAAIEEILREREKGISVEPKPRENSVQHALPVQEFYLGFVVDICLIGPGLALAIGIFLLVPSWLPESWMPYSLIPAVILALLCFSQVVRLSKYLKSRAHHWL